MTFEYISKIAFSLALSSLSTLPTGDASDAAKRVALENIRAHDFRLLLLMTALVAVGVVLEGPEIAHEAKAAWLSCRGKRRKVREAAPWITLAAAFGWVIIVVGVAGEGYWDSVVSHDDQQILTFDEDKLETTEKEAGDARQSALDAKAAAADARADADAAGLRVTAVSKEANQIGTGLHKTQDSLAWQGLRFTTISADLSPDRYLLDSGDHNL